MNVFEIKKDKKNWLLKKQNTNIYIARRKRKKRKRKNDVANNILSQKTWVIEKKKRERC
jgi:hypothetical protein